MAFPVPQFRPPPLPEPTPIVRVVAREDAPWNRPLFKAPALEVEPNMFMFGPALEALRESFLPGR